MSQRNKTTPSNWDAYERGRASSFGSLESVPEDQQPELSSSATRALHDSRSGERHEDDGHGLRRRRSSITQRLNSIRQMGGPNSIDNFAKSFQRAAGFREITPVRRNSITIHDEEADAGAGSSSHDPPQKSLLRQQFEEYDSSKLSGTESAIDDHHEEEHPATEQSQLLPSSSRQLSKPSMNSLRPSSVAPSFGMSYGSISSRLSASAHRRATILIQERQEASQRAMEAPGSEYKAEYAEPHIEREVRPDGEVIERTVGESTVPMTIFNSTNVLIGVGILALPLGIKYSGWVIGLLFLTFAAWVTSYTAKLLAKCLDTNSGSTTYGDIAFLAFDSWGRNTVEFLFILELTACNVALIILFADSMNSLIPGLSTVGWKCIIAIGLIPLNFVPFSTLSVTSILGIVCCMGIIVIVFVDGLIKPHAPGSLREVAKTFAFPENLRTIPLSLGLFMAPWGGHSVFPAIYKDMRHPQKYPRAIKYTYFFTYGLDLSMAVLGYLMFGDFVRDEVTSNILNSRSKAYPAALSIIIVLMIAIIPVTKIPLSNRPMTDTINKKFYIDLRQMDPKARQRSEKSWKHRLARGFIAVLVNFIQLGISILFPDFDSIMALMGSALCFTICVILPVAFYLKIFSREGKEISPPERILDYFLIAICAALGIVGTVFAIMPKEKLGAKIL